MPSDLVALLGRAEVGRSLNTRDPKEARRRAGLLQVRVGEVWERIRVGGEGLDDRYAELLQAALDLEDAVRRRIALEAELRVAEAKVEAVKGERRAAEQQAALLDRMTDQAREVEAERSRVEQERAAGKLNPEGLDALKEILDRAGVVVRDRPTPTVLEFLEATFIPERRLQEDANRHVTGYVRMFAKVLGDRPLASYTRADVQRWVRTLEKVRTSYGKGGKDHAKPIALILRESADKPKLGATTIEKHVTHLRQVFMLAARHHRFATSDDVEALFADVRLGRDVPEPETRRLWSPAQLTALFRSPVWSGTRARADDFTHRHEEGPHVHVDAYWWLPVVALHSGLRLEEIAQLRHADLHEDEGGRPFLGITDKGPGQRLKTKSSRRGVPLHPFLVETGFPRLFVPGRAGWVFPELKLAGRPPKRGGQYSEDFTAYRRACGLYERLRDFHSFRHTLVTALREAGADAGVVAHLVGHRSDPTYARWEQTDGYTTFSVAAYSRALDLLDWEARGVDLSFVRAAARLVGGPRGTARAEDVAAEAARLRAG